MNKKTVILVLIAILTLTGCTNEANEYNPNISDYYYIHIDKETCVEYFVSFGSNNLGNFNPRYNTDGTLKINKECINKLEVNKDE